MQAGSYNEKDELIYSWEDLISKGAIIVEDNKLLTNVKHAGIEIINIKMPKNITIIEDYAFCNCTNLIKVELSNNLKQIKTGAFCKCYDLKEIIIPNSLVNIEAHPFFDCHKLEKITYYGKKEEFEKINGWENLFAGNNLKIENVIFHKTLDELIEEGKSFREANAIIKKQKEEQFI